MKNTLKIIGMISLTSLTACNTVDNTSSVADKSLNPAINKQNKAPLTNAEVLLADHLAERLKMAGDAFRNNENAELKEINAGNNNSNNSNGDLKDTPNTVSSEAFMAPATNNSGKEMICFNEKTGTVMTAATPGLVGTAFNSGLMQQIISSFNADGKSVIRYSTATQDLNNSKHTIQENMIIVAWNELALTGANKKGIVCTISAPAPIA